MEIVSASGTAATDFTVISGGSQQEPTTAPQETTAAPQETAAAAQEPTAKEPQETTAATQETTKDSTAQSSTAQSSAGDISSPETGDSSHAGVWIAVAVIFAFFIWLILTLKSAQDYNNK